jgi:tetratricopeptide (TPR) repeat protein
MIFRFRVLFTAIVMMLAMSCSTKRSGFVSRTFHNLSAHYNAYYNAGLKVEEGRKQLSDGQKDQYDRILPIFKYGGPEQAKAVYPQMDEAIKKTSLTIQRHTLVDKNGNELPDKEKWVDDNWLLYGQALFYKHEYFAAIETFKYVESTYKKEPTRFSASLWLARTYLQLTQLREAEDRLDYIRNQKGLPKDVKAEYDAVAADYYLQTRNFDQAIQHLTRASVSAKKRSDRIRYMFILAQIHQSNGDFKEAFRLYTTVIKKNPEYEMAFNARINRARCFDAESETSAGVKAELLKMAKDPKNKEYLDQVYYALAGISKKEKNEPEEIDYLNKSIAASTANQNQKALSYLELGKIYFEKPDYRNAQAYYDSSISNLSTDHPDYPDILTLRNSLTKLIKNLNIISSEDSLQKLARLSEEDLNKMVNDVIKKEEENRKRIEEEEKEQQVKQLFNQTDNTTNQKNQTSGSSWYFYNPTTLDYGSKEFTRKWGSRKLEDDWRRSNKQVFSQEEEVSDSLVTEEKELADTAAIRQVKKKELLAKIPSTPEALEKSTNKVVDAYYNASMIYNEQLKNAKASAELFEEMLRRHPENKYKLQAYYHLYRIYLTHGNTTKSDFYKNLLLEKYPDSDFAMIIKNPNYMAEKAQKKSSLELFYEETYRKYLNGEYADVIVRKAQAEQMYPNNILTPKFDLLRTLAIGRTQNVSVFTASLQDIVRNYSTDPVKDEAQNILDFINGQSGQQEDKLPPAPDTTVRLYNYNPDTTHIVIVSFNSSGLVNGNQIRAKLSDYNSKYYSLKNYIISSIILNPTTQIIPVTRFDNKDDALSYRNSIANNDEVFGNTNPELYNVFVVSDNNYEGFLREKDVDEYLDYYRNYYQ